MFKKGDVGFHPVYGQVTVLRDATENDYFIPVKMTLNHKPIDYVQLSIRSIKRG